MVRWVLRGRTQPPAAVQTVRVVAPSADELWLAGTAERQNLLAQCDRSPGLMRLTVIEGGVQVSDRADRVVGIIAPAEAAAFATAVRRWNRKGTDIHVHGQVLRRDLDLCVVLHCPPPAAWRAHLSPPR